MVKGQAARRSWAPGPPFAPPGCCGRRAHKAEPAFGAWQVEDRDGELARRAAGATVRLGLGRGLLSAHPGGVVGAGEWAGKAAPSWPRASRQTAGARVAFGLTSACSGRARRAGVVWLVSDMAVVQVLCGWQVNKDARR